MRNINECIASRAFASLIVDSEYPADEYFPAKVICRVLIEDLFQDYIIAESRSEAIELFNKWHR